VRPGRLRDHEMARLYRSGLKLTEIGNKFGLSKTSVWKALKRVGCERRNTGTPRRRPIVVKPHAPYRAPPPALTWCSQCERNVSMIEAGRCGSRFCKAVKSDDAANRAEFPHKTVGDQPQAGA
jgi:hypothetical protein